MESCRCLLRTNATKSDRTQVASSGSPSDSKVLFRTIPSIMPILASSNALPLLKTLQATLDPTDISDVVARFRATYPDSDLFATDLVPEPSTEELTHFIDIYLSSPSAGRREESWSLRQRLIAYALSAIFKDCSIFVKAVLSPSPSGDLVLDKEKSTVKLIDLDLKPMSSLRKWTDLDEKIWRYWRDTKSHHDAIVGSTTSVTPGEGDLTSNAIDALQTPPRPNPAISVPIPTPQRAGPDPMSLSTALTLSPVERLVTPFNTDHRRVDLADALSISPSTHTFGPDTQSDDHDALSDEGQVPPPSKGVGREGSLSYRLGPSQLGGDDLESFVESRRARSLAPSPSPLPDVHANAVESEIGDTRDEEPTVPDGHFAIRSDVTSEGHSAYPGSLQTATLPPSQTGSDDHTFRTAGLPYPLAANSTHEEGIDAINPSSLLDMPMETVSPKDMHAFEQSNHSLSNGSYGDKHVGGPMLSSYALGAPIATPTFRQVSLSTQHTWDGHLNPPRPGTAASAEGSAQSMRTALEHITGEAATAVPDGSTLRDTPPSSKGEPRSAVTYFSTPYKNETDTV